RHLRASRQHERAGVRRRIRPSRLPAARGRGTFRNGARSAARHRNPWLLLPHGTVAEGELLMAGKKKPARKQAPRKATRPAKTAKSAKSAKPRKTGKPAAKKAPTSAARTRATPERQPMSMNLKLPDIRELRPRI